MHRVFILSFFATVALPFCSSPAEAGLLRSSTSALLPTVRLCGRLWLLQTAMPHCHENVQGSGLREAAVHLLQNMLQASLGNQDHQLRQIRTRNVLPGMSLHGLQARL